jgi:hypothetical protein
MLFCTISVSSQNSIPKNYNPSNGLPSADITNLTQDITGYLWLGTQKQGIIRFDGYEFENFTENDGLISNNVHHILFKNDTLFIATDKGLSIRTKNTFVNISGEEILKIREANHKTLLVTKQGVYQFKKREMIPIKLNYQIDLSPIQDIQYYENGYYIATTKTLWFVNNLKNPTKIVRINEGNFTSLKLLKGQLFATTKNKGIQVFETNKNRMRFTSIKRITSINFTNNQYWISTDNNGVYIYNDDFTFEKRISKYNGLKVNHISSVFVDRIDNCWLTTIGNGLYKYVPQKAKTTKHSEIYFENIEVDFQSIDSILINSYRSTLQLKPNQNTISFSYKTVDINNPTKLEYRWKLNNDLSPWSTKNSIDFANLSSGDYTFQVQSRNKSLQESSFIQFLFFIDTPIYKKDWFIYSITGVSIVIAIIIILLVFRSIRKKNAKKIKQLQLENHLLSLEQKAMQLQMNPHFIFNVLNGIKALGSQQKSEEMNDTINNFAGLLRGVLHNSRKEEISLQQEVETLQKYVLLEQQMSANNFEFTIDTSNVIIDIDEILIPPMLIQPFIENAIKHGISHLKTSGLVTLLFEVKGNFIHCTIVDNGIGYKHSKKESTRTNHQSVALKVTKERIESISGKQSFYISEIIENKEVKGTKVWFRIPLKTEF